MGFNRRKMQAQRAAAAEKKRPRSARPRPKFSKTPAASSQRGMNGKPSACQCCSRRRSAARSNEQHTRRVLGD